MGAGDEDTAAIEALDRHWMQQALRLAERAEAAGEVPVGALIVKDGELIAEGWNQPISRNDPSAHAEIIALRAAGERLGNYRLPDTTLYVTLEPCTMCVGAMIHARVRRLVFGAHDPKTGAAGGALDVIDAPVHNHRIEVTGGVLEAACAERLKLFFQRRRK